MKIKIISSCVGMDGEHLEAGETVDYPENDAKNLIKFNRAVSLDAEKPKSAAKTEKADDAEDGLEEDPDLGEETKAPAKGGKKGK